MNYVGYLEDANGNKFYPETLESSDILYSGGSNDLTVTLDKSIKGYDFVEVIFQRSNDYGSASTGKMYVYNKDTDNASAYGTAELIYITNSYQARITIKVDIVGDTLTKRSHRINFNPGTVSGPAAYNEEPFWLVAVIGYIRNK